MGLCTSHAFPDYPFPIYPLTRPVMTGGLGGHTVAERHMTQTHNEYFIEKEQLPVDLTMVTGEELSGALFVQPTWRRPSIEFDAPVLLHLPDAFFPLVVGNGRARLIAKSQVVLMRGERSGIDDDSEALGEPASVVIRCSSGVIVRGSLRIARLKSNTRVLDYLNRSTEEFILLHERDGAVLVNRRHIVIVHDESDGPA